MEPMMIADWSDVVMKRDDYGQLLDAIMERNYSALYAELKKEIEEYAREKAISVKEKLLQELSKQ